MLKEPLNKPTPGSSRTGNASNAESDEQLLSRIKEGSQASLEILYKRYFPRLSRFITQITQDAHETLDIINEVFLSVWNDAEKFRGDSSLSTWIIGIAYNKSLSALRKKRKWLSFTDELPDAPIPEHEEPQRADDIRQAMKRLKPEQRAMVELTYYFGYSYDEIAQMLDCKAIKVRDQLYMARKQIKSAVSA